MIISLFRYILDIVIVLVITPYKAYKNFYMPYTSIYLIEQLKSIISIYLKGL